MVLIDLNRMILRDQCLLSAHDDKQNCAGNEDDNIHVQCLEFERNITRMKILCLTVGKSDTVDCVRLCSGKECKLSLLCL